MKRCTICTHPNHLEMLRYYAVRRSLRGTACRFGVGYRSLLRHIEKCITLIMEEFERESFRQEYKQAIEDARMIYGWLYRPRPKRSVIKKKIKVSWGRKHWARMAQKTKARKQKKQ